MLYKSTSRWHINSKKLIFLLFLPNILWGNPTIGSHQAVCRGENPAPIESLDVDCADRNQQEYFWMMSFRQSPMDSGDWAVIPGATQACYTPAALVQTAYYTRCSRQPGSSTIIESNIVRVEVLESPYSGIVGPSELKACTESRFYPSVLGNGYRYRWDFGANAEPRFVDGFEASTSFCPWTNNATIRLQVTNENGCSFINTLELAVALPVELLYFEANTNQYDQVQLAWATANEINNKQFTIEKSSDGREFLPIKVIPGAGHSQEQLSYNYTDPVPWPGRNYYRLKQEDFDGTFEYSDLVDIYREPSNKIQLFPNPVKTVVQLHPGFALPEGTRLELFDNAGRLISSRPITPGEISISLDISSLPDGIYFVQLKASQLRLGSQKLIKS